MHGPALGCILLTCALACQGPQARHDPMDAMGNPKYLQVLQADYGLALAPPVELTVRVPRPGGPGSFHMVVREPGWSLSAALETIRVRTREGPAGTVFDWELPGGRVADRAGSGRTLLLRLSRGTEHRPLAIRCEATPEPVGGKVQDVLRGVSWIPALVIAAPFAALDYAVEPSRYAAPPAPALPGPGAPACCTEGATRILPGLDRDGAGRRFLRIRVETAGAPPGAAPPLESVRAAVACFQPERAADLDQDPAAPGAFRLALNPADLERPGSFLLVERFSYRNLPQYAIWAIYYDAGGGWAKAWRLTLGALDPEITGS